MQYVAFALSGLALAGWVYLAIFHDRFWQLLLDEPADEPAAWPSIDIVVPARNEAEVLPKTLASLVAQDYPGEWRIIVVDDHSDDGTGELARRYHSVTVIVPPPLAEGWSGKVAAMSAGAAQSQAEFILFTDADIEHPANSLRRLAARSVARNLDLTSRMVRLRCESPAEKLLVPAFVFFFAMLYPFRGVNDARSRIAAAAGGVMLARRRMLDAIGGLARIKSALIDDCTLAKAIKDAGGRIELTLVDDIQSLREYPTFGDIHRTVARTAYTQLRCSPSLLIGTCLGMAVLFGAPPLLLAGGYVFGALLWLIMSAIYVPMITFYKLPAAYALTLPVAAGLYVVATLDSARLHGLGRGGGWKGRVAGSERR